MCVHVQQILYSERERTVKEAYATGYTGGTGMTSQVASALAAARSADRSQHGPVSADASVRFGRAHFAPSQEGFAAQFGPYAGAPYTAKNHHHLLPLILPCEDRSQHRPAWPMPARASAARTLRAARRALPRSLGPTQVQYPFAHTH